MVWKASSAALILALSGLISCSRDPKAAARGYLESGNKYFAKGRYTEARLMYMRARQKDLRFGDAYYRLGLAEIRLGNYNPAVQAFERAIELIPPSRPERTDSMVKASDILLVAAHQEHDARNQKEYLDNVARWSAELLKRDSNSFDGHRILGDLELAKSVMDAKAAQKQSSAGHLERAIAEYHQADSIKPGESAIALQLARSMSTKGDLASAEQLYRQVLDHNKNAETAYTELYKLLWFQKKADAAEELLRTAYRNNPKQVTWLTTLALQYSQQGRRAEMVSVLDQIKAHSKDYPDAYLVVGDFYYRLGDPNTAIADYNEGIAKDPARKSLYEKHVIEVMLHQNRQSEAAEINAQILKESPKDTDARGLAATLLLEKGDATKAIADLQSVVTAAPNNPVARFDLGRAYFARGDWEAARQAFEKALEIKPDYIQPRLALAKLLLTRGEFDAALKAAQAILNSYDGRNATARLIASASLIGLSRYAEARSLLEPMAKGSSFNSPEVYLQLGVLNLDEKRYREAEDAFAKSYRLKPTDTRGLAGVVRCYLAEGKPDAAIDLLRAESDKAPNRGDLRLALANGALDGGKPDLAIAEYQKVLDSLEKDSRQRASVYLRLGEAYRVKHDFSPAIANMQKARETLPDDTSVLTNLALTLDEAGRTSESRQAYEAALKLDPNNGLILNNLAYLLAEHGGDLNDALTKALKAKQLLPNLAQASDTLGVIYLRKGLNDNAVDIFKDLVVKAPDQPTYRYHLGLALSQKGAKADAVKELRASLKYNPSQDEREKIEQLLVKLKGA